MTTIRQSTEIRKEQIKEAVRLLIHEKGFRGLSIHNLAEKLGLSEGAIYRHFASKEQIIFDIVQDVKNEMIERMKQIALKEAPPDRRLHDFMCYHIRYLIKNKGITILLFTEATYQQNILLRDHLHEIFQSIKQYFSKIVIDGITLGLWDAGLSVESMATLYMSIPLTLNIEMNLQPHEGFQHDFCERMYLLIRKVLEKKE
jgi:AcrR family transcriptional regulator